MPSETKSDDKSKKAEPRAVPELPTPHEHAAATGRMLARRTQATGQSHFRYTREHQLAAHVHGWNACRVATGAEPRICRDDYEAALKAVTVELDDKGKPRPLSVHRAACAKDHAPEHPFGKEGTSR